MQYVVCYELSLLVVGMSYFFQNDLLLRHPNNMLPFFRSKSRRHEGCLTSPIAI